MTDQAARERAARCYDKNLVVVAGAGTGKTSLLVERLLNQLVEQDLELEQVAAITFTEKAATEMRSRLELGLARLVELTRDPDPTLEEREEADRAFRWLRVRIGPAELRARAERLLARVGHATVSTIHAFCSSLLRRFPVEAGIDPDFSVDDGLLYETLRDEVWEDFLSGPDGPEGERAELWRDVLVRLDLWELEAMARASGGFGLPNAHAPALAPQALALGPLLEDRLESISDLLKESPARGPESYLAASKEVLLTLRSEGFEAFGRALAAASFEPGRGPAKGLLDGSAAPTSTRAPEATQLAKLLRRLLERLERVDDALLSAALELVAPYGRRVREECRRRNLLPFDGLLVLTRDLLSMHTHVRRRLAQRIRLLLLDEFQDTDPLQYEIVFLLSEDPDTLPVPDAFDTQLLPGKLFIVGDPKQAIYRFRGADIAAYHAAIDHVLRPGGERLALTTSWRARPEVLEPLDRLFPGLLEPPDQAEGHVFSGYETLESGRERASDGPRVEVWRVGDETTKRRAETARLDEGEAIGEWIATQCEAGRIVPGDVAVLFRALTKVHLYTRALRARRIPFSLETGRDLIERPEGQQLLALLRALANPIDAPAVLGVLRSALGGATDEELARWAAEGGWFYPTWKPDPDRFPQVARTFDLLRHWHEASLHRPLDEVLTGLVDETPLLALQASASDGAARVTNLRARLDPLIARARREPSHTLVSILPWLERIERSGTTGRTDTERGAVRIMSVHAAKGLEFPVVIVPDLGRARDLGGWQGPVAELAWLRGAHGLAVRTPDAISSGWPEHEREEERHREAEGGRLFYVACTRARERLIFLHAPRPGIPRDAPIHYLDSLLGLTTPPPDDVALRSLTPPGRTRLAPRPAPETDSVAEVARARALAERATRLAVAPFQRPTGIREQVEAALEATDDDATPRARSSPDLGLATGTVLHDVLERWDFRDADAARALLRSAVARAARDDAQDPARLEKEAAGVLERVLASDLPGYLAGLSILGRELPMLFRDPAGTAWSGTLDLLYLDPDGRPVVADYKTDRDPGPETHERYRPQLETYAKGVELALSRAPALELIYLRSGERVRLQAG